MTDQSKPLFVPLAGVWFDQFASGVKTWEHRLARRQWNTRQVYVGRRVTLSRGYGKSRRLHGVITQVLERPYSDMPEDMSFYRDVTPATMFISFKIQLDKDSQ